jgi:hypothetical protein
MRRVSVGVNDAGIFAQQMGTRGRVASRSACSASWVRHRDVEGVEEGRRTGDGRRNTNFPSVGMSSSCPVPLVTLLVEDDAADAELIAIRLDSASVSLLMS